MGEARRGHRDGRGRHRSSRETGYRIPDERQPPTHALLAAQGVHAARGHLVLAALSDGRWWTTRDLVRATAVAHRVVVDTLAAVDTELERDGDRVRLHDPARYARLADRPRLADPVGHLVDAYSDVEAELGRLVEAAPPPRTDLDHVSATARTALRRALFLTTRFTTHGARLLCVGDHDLTSLALTLVDPDAEAIVVDIDERMLDYIDTAAARLGRNVRCYFADLRVGLPPAVRGSADLVFTDPPYTPEGVELFVRRGLEGAVDPKNAHPPRLRPAKPPRRSPPRPAAFTRLHCHKRWPDFNRYLGRKRSVRQATCVLRATARTPWAGWGTTTRSTQGAQAREAPHPSPPRIWPASGEHRPTSVWGMADRFRRRALRLRAAWLAEPNQVQRAAVN